jgi:Xaa-Pro aminopeptidase
MGSGKLSHEIIQQKLAQAAQKLEEGGIDLWVTFVQETSSGAERIFEYISPGDLTWESAVLLRRGGGSAIICGSFDQKDFEDSQLYDRVVPYVADFKVPFVEYLKEASPRKVALNYSLDDASADGITHGKFVFIKGVIEETLPGVEIVSADRVIGALVSQKTESERAAVQEAVGITVGLFEELKGFLKSGLTEKQVYDFIQGRMAALGVEPSFHTLVFSGDRGAGMGHAAATDNDLRPGDLLHVDMGVWVRGYASDMQRTWYILKPGEETPPEAARKGFHTIARAIAEAAKVLKPGVEGHAVDAVSRKVITDAGYPEYPHALGHQLGHHVHDGGSLLGPAWPRYKKTPFMTAELGQIHTLEPSLTVPGHGAIGLEDDVVVGPGGAEFLAATQTELWIIR